MRVYYAHCQALYGTPQEDRDINILERLGFTVLNPNGVSLPEVVTMDFFFDLVITCDVVAFRSLPDGAIPAGVAGEIATAQKNNIPVIEIPSGILRRGINVEETREFLSEIGQR